MDGSNRRRQHMGRPDLEAFQAGADRGIARDGGSGWSGTGYPAGTIYIKEVADTEKPGAVTPRGSRRTWLLTMRGDDDACRFSGR